MQLQKKLRIVVAGVAASLLASFAHGLAISDATIRNTSGGLDNSSAALMGTGKIKNANVNAFTGLFAGDEWSLLDRTNKSSKPFNDVNFVLSADTGQRSGEWALDWVGSDVPEYMDYILVLKSGKQWGAFLFESASLAPQDVGGGFKISWLNKKGKVPKLRHASIFGRTGVAPDSSTDGAAGPGGGNGDPNDHTNGLGDGTGPGDGKGGPGDGTVGPGDGTTGLGDGTNGPGDGKDGPSGPGGQAGAAAATDVPTPGTLVLLVMGLGLILMQRRHRQKR